MKESLCFSGHNQPPPIHCVNSSRRPVFAPYPSSTACSPTRTGKCQVPCRGGTFSTIHPNVLIAQKRPRADSPESRWRDNIWPSPPQGQKQAHRKLPPSPAWPRSGPAFMPECGISLSRKTTRESRGRYTIEEHSGTFQCLLSGFDAGAREAVFPAGLTVQAK